MPSLLDRPADEVIQLLRVVARAYHEAGRQWPTWQYVLWAADQETLDADRVVRALPEWGHRYTYVFRDLGDGENIEGPGSKLGLTAVGMFHAADPLCNQLLQFLVGAIRGLEQRQRATRPDPTAVSRSLLSSGEALEISIKQSGVSVDLRSMQDLLLREPAMRNGVTRASGSWAWDNGSVRLARFRGIQSGQDYLARLEEMIGTPSSEAARPSLPPSSLADAFDHTNAVWQNVLGEPLLRYKVGGVISNLALPVNGEAEFMARCSELAIVFNWFATGRKEDRAAGQRGLGPLAGLQETLRQHLGEDTAAIPAVRVLRDINAVRTGQQHRETDNKALEAKARLGIGALGNDWSASWELLRHRVIDSLTVIRQELQGTSAWD